MAGSPNMSWLLLDKICNKFIRYAYVERSHVPIVQFSNWSGEYRALRVRLVRDIILVGLRLEGKWPK